MIAGGWIQSVVKLGVIKMHDMAASFVTRAYHCQDVP